LRAICATQEREDIEKDITEKLQEIVNTDTSHDTNCVYQKCKNKLEELKAKYIEKKLKFNYCYGMDPVSNQRQLGGHDILQMKIVDVAAFTSQN
jgi:hypothetical protein